MTGVHMPSGISRHDTPPFNYETYKYPDTLSPRSCVDSSRHELQPSDDVLHSQGIAVLPLENLSDDKENAFFVDGSQDDVLTSLAKIKDLRDISRASVRFHQ